MALSYLVEERWCAAMHAGRKHVCADCGKEQLLILGTVAASLVVAYRVEGWEPSVVHAGLY